MTPTRPYSLSVSKRVHWALRIVSAGLRGDSPLTPELTSDGIAEQLLTDAIEAKWPGLLEQYSQRERFDADAVKRVAEAVGRDGQKVKEGQE